MPLVLVLHPRDHLDLEDRNDDLAAEIGVLSTHVARHVQALQHISRCHVYRIGDGSATCTSGSSPAATVRPSSWASWLVVWDDLLLEYPSAVAETDAAIMGDALVASYGGRRGPTSV